MPPSSPASSSCPPSRCSGATNKDRAITTAKHCAHPQSLLTAWFPVGCNQPRAGFQRDYSLFSTQLNKQNSESWETLYKGKQNIKSVVIYLTSIRR